MLPAVSGSPQQLRSPPTCETVADRLAAAASSGNNKGAAKTATGSRFDLFTNIFRKKPRETECEGSEETPSSTDPAVNESLLHPPPELGPALRTSPVDIPAAAASATGGSSGSRGPVASRSPVSPRVRSLERDMEVLRQSRQDNPYLQHQLERLSLQQDGDGDNIAKRKDWPVGAFSSPRRQDQERLVEPEDTLDSEEGEDDLGANLHEHLIRSPPPMFPLNVNQFTFPELGRGILPPTALSPSRPGPQQVLDSRNNHHNNNNHHATVKSKGSLPLISFDEQQQQQQQLQHQRDREGSPSTSSSPALPSPTLPLGARETPNGFPNSRPRLQSQGDLNPLLIKSGVDALDPSMRKVLASQRHGLPLNDADHGTSDAGRRSVDLPLQRSPLAGKSYGGPHPSTAGGGNKKWSSPPTTGSVRPFGPSCSPSLPALLDDSCRDPTLGPVKGAKPPPCPAAVVRPNYWEY